MMYSWAGTEQAAALTHNMEGGAQRLGCVASSISSTAAVLSPVPLLHFCYGGRASVEVSTTAVRGASDAAIRPSQDHQIRLYATTDSAGNDSLLTNSHHWIWKLYHSNNWGIHWERKRRKKGEWERIRRVMKKVLICRCFILTTGLIYGTIIP